MPHFLFPADPFQSMEVDPKFVDQQAAFDSAGNSTSVCSDEAIAGLSSLRGIAHGARVVYRGWMLTEVEYRRLTEAIARVGAVHLTSPESYLTAHHLPNWYLQLAEFTPETRVYPADCDIVRELQRLDWEGFFLKDYVKSLKTSCGSLIQRPEDALALLRKMEHYRGEIEGGICVRRMESFVPDSERRYFVIHGTPFASRHEETIPDVVQHAAERIASPFFSVDVALRADGMLRIVEIGDGQVSDPLGWTTSRFAEIWKKP